MKKLLMHIAVIIASVFTATVIAAMPACAAQNDIRHSVLFELKENAQMQCGEAFVRNGALWVPVASLREMGAKIDDASNGKGVYIYAENPAALFGNH